MVDSSLRGSCRRMRPVLPFRTRKPSTSSMPRWTEARHGLLPVRGTQRRGRPAQPAIPPTRSTRFQSWHSLWAYHLTPCMPCSFAVPRRTRSEPRPQSNGPHRVTVTVRWIPLATAAYGTRVARPPRTTPLQPGGDSFSSARERGPSPVTAASWARARRARGSLIGTPALARVLPVTGTRRPPHRGGNRCPADAANSCRCHQRRWRLARDRGWSDRAAPEAPPHLARTT
jgi:hypothetical protein